jgi:hypothetical protein
MIIEQVEVQRSAFQDTRVTQHPAPELAEGEVLAKIDRFALTANNVSYALSGDMIGYWKFFPTGDPAWGVVPVWGFADVIASRSDAIGVGERFWGFLPMASHLVLQPAAVTERAFFDGAAHRRDLPNLYNQYQRVSADPPELKALENERCVLFPLFSTSFIVADYLVDNAYFGAAQVVVASASSKTGFGLCHLLSRAEGPRPRVIGLTSPRNLAFVQNLAVCDEVKTYEDIAALDPSLPTAFVDMAGNASVVSAVHSHFGANLTLSSFVGATHWDTPRFAKADHGGAPYTFFFAPSQFAKREKDWGPGETIKRAFSASARMAVHFKGALTPRHDRGAEQVAQTFSALASNQIAADVAVMASINP